MLWHDGCIGKFRHMGIPISFTNWIKSWLENRRGYIEINNGKSNWFCIGKGGPQGSPLTPTIFITYHADMSMFLSWSSSHLFADDLAAVVSSQIGVKFSTQCLDFEKRIKFFLNKWSITVFLLINLLTITKQKRCGVQWHLDQHPLKLKLKVIKLIRLKNLNISIILLLLDWDGEN